MMDWQPFDSAPTDGTHILAYWPRHPFDEDENMNEAIDLGGIITVTFRSGNGWVDPDYLDATGAWFGDDCCYAPVPTKWHALPPPPTAQVQADAGAVTGGAEAETEIDFEVWVNDERLASATDAIEAMRYAHQYAEEGPVRVLKATTVREQIACIAAARGNGNG